MVPGGLRRTLAAGAAATSLAVILAVGALSSSRSDPRPAPGPPVGEPAAAPPGDDAPAPGRPALVTVAVAGIWHAPAVARPLDEPSLTNPVDLRRWISSMSDQDKLWLVDRLVTQALYGERVVVREVSGDWARVVVTGQASHLDPEGYPGWMPVAQLRAAELPATAASAVVTRPAATLGDARQPGRQLLEVSYNTRLPVLEAGAVEVTVALPTGGTGVLAAADVEVQEGARRRPTTGAELVRHAQAFAGLPYLWAGTSAFGFDCSGFIAAVYGVHGIALPRDADDQAGTGVAVDRARLQPGDLLFFSTGPDRESIRHVAMYAGDGMVVQSPSTGRAVDTVALDTAQDTRQLWGARRYLPAGSP